MKKLKMIFLTPIDLWQQLITYYPGTLGFILRRNFWKNRLKYLGKGVKIDIGTHFQNPGYITLDDKSWIDRNVIILAGPPYPGRITYEKNNPLFTLDRGEVYIGRQTHIAPNCVLSGIGGLYIGSNSGVASNSAIYSFSHHFRNLDDRDDFFQYSFTPLARPDQQSMILSPVYIGDYCAVGLNSIILPGACIKRGSWVASGSVIMGTYPEQSLVRTEQETATVSLAKYAIKE